MQFYTRKKRPLIINIVSLIDILTLLLIFFLVTTTFKKQEPKVQIKLPESSTAQKSEETRPLIIIYATKNQQVLLGEKEVPLNSLANILKKEKDENKVFALKADTDIPLGFFVKVLDASKEAGLDNLSLFTEPPKNTP